MSQKLYYLLFTILIPVMLLSVGSLVSAQDTLTEKHTPKPSHPASDTILDLCMSTEPASLYYYAFQGFVDPWQAQVLDAIYDGPIDTRSYSYQPVIFDSTSPGEWTGGYRDSGGICWGPYRRQRGIVCHYTRGGFRPTCPADVMEKVVLSFTQVDPWKWSTCWLQTPCCQASPGQMESR